MCRQTEQDSSQVVKGGSQTPRPRRQSESEPGITNRVAAMQARGGMRTPLSSPARAEQLQQDSTSPSRLPDTGHLSHVCSVPKRRGAPAAFDQEGMASDSPSSAHVSVPRAREFWKFERPQRRDQLRLATPEFPSLTKAPFPVLGCWLLHHPLRQFRLECQRDT